MIHSLPGRSVGREVGHKAHVAHVVHDYFWIRRVGSYFFKLGVKGIENNSQLL